MAKLLPDTPTAAAGQRQVYHHHTRTVSSSVFPMATSTSPSQSSYQHTVNMSRRTPSNATASSSATGNGVIPTRTPSGSSTNNLRRSTSSRSGASLAPSSYVALMRKQKATVWCDRAQHEDPRMLAQQKQAKLRATMEVEGGTTQGRTSTSGSMGSGSLGVRSKIRHHGLPKASVVGYNVTSLASGGVPMRLSASEAGDDGHAEEDTDSQRNMLYKRGGSGRSSLASNQRLAPYNQRQSALISQGSTPPSGQESSPIGTPSEYAETPVPGEQQRRAGGDYFQQPSENGGSGSSSERESSFGNVGDMHAPIAKVVKEDAAKKSEELSRRGSVDERAPTMRGAVRLFVANPDLSD